MTGWVVTGPIRYKGHDVIRRDIEDFKAALNGVAIEGAFMPGVAPASVAPDRLDEHYRNEEESLCAMPRRCAKNIKRSSMPALSCRSTTPTWRPLTK